MMCAKQVKRRRRRRRTRTRAAVKHNGASGRTVHIASPSAAGGGRGRKVARVQCSRATMPPLRCERCRGPRPMCTMGSADRSLPEERLRSSSIVRYWIAPCASCHWLTGLAKCPVGSRAPVERPREGNHIVPSARVAAEPLSAPMSHATPESRGCCNSWRAPAELNGRARSRFFLFCFVFCSLETFENLDSGGE